MLLDLRMPAWLLLGALLQPLRELLALLRAQLFESLLRRLPVLIRRQVTCNVVVPLGHFLVGVALRWMPHIVAVREILIVLLLLIAPQQTLQQLFHRPSLQFS